MNKCFQIFYFFIYIILPLAGYKFDLGGNGNGECQSYYSIPLVSTLSSQCFFEFDLGVNRLITGIESGDYLLYYYFDYCCDIFGMYAV